MRRKDVKIVLVNPPLPSGVSRHEPSIPIGLAYLASVVERNGYAVKVVDCPPLDMDYDTMKREVSSFNPTIIGITSMTSTFPSALQAAYVLKESCPGALTLLGGPHVTFMDITTLKEHQNIDIVVRKEGEETLLELLRCWVEEKTFDRVAGITFRKNRKIVRTSDRPFIQNLDKLPYPAYHLFPLEKYRLRGRIFRKTVLPIMTSRGCPFRCSFCLASKMVGRMLRVRTPKSVVDELEWLRDEHGAEAFSFYDDTLTFNKERCYEIFEQMRRRRVDLPWNCQTRTDLVSKELLVAMKRAGCQFVSFGVESGSPKLLKAMGKGTTVKINEKAVKLAKEAGLLVGVSIIIGYPGESTETLNETFAFIERVKPDAVYLCTPAPYPGTELYELVKDLGWKMFEDWTKYNTVNFAFENPSLPNEFVEKMREKFYDSFYSHRYILRHFCKGNLYSGIMARTALNHYLWRIRNKFKRGNSRIDKF